MLSSSGAGDTSDSTQRKGTTTILLLLIAFLIGISSIFNLIVGNQVAIKSVGTNVVTDNDPTTKQLPPNLSVYNGEEITKFLTGELQFPTGCTRNMNGRCRLKFKPGTLQLSSVQTLQQ
ncbi:hypothetical protein QTG54_007942 [Skeletonema marinoi]|nr:hypothetical protein QTG54_007942 [Skeletonema marinoi]